MKQDNYASPILFSGPSGIGKTTLIEKLITLYPEKYARPLSLTTRARRPSEGDSEYRFVSDEEFSRYEAEDRLANSDTAYGNRYGITKESLSALCERTICPAKEVHPQNHHKIRSLFPDTISVLFTSKRKPAYDNDPSRSTRFAEDERYYSALSHDGFDLIFPIPPIEKLGGAVEHLHGTLQCLLANTRHFPRAGEIERTNRENYAVVLPEFDDSRRPTTANFHQMTLSYWNQIARTMIEKPKVLELGVGNGWLMKSVRWPQIEYTGVDVVPSDDPSVITASSREMCFESETFDYALSSLADPFLFPASIREIHRVLKPGGRFIFSVPAKEWANKLRGHASRDKTTFRLESGRGVEVYSFCADREWLTAALPTYGFRLIGVETMTIRDLPPNTEISSAIAVPSERMGDLPIVHATIVERI